VNSVLVIAGSDSSGGAGIARDLQTLANLGVGAQCVLTAITAQTDQAVTAAHAVPPEVVRAQLEAALSVERSGAVKIGMLATSTTVSLLASLLPSRDLMPSVLDPVLHASSGGALLEGSGVTPLRRELCARVTVLTPNLPESAALLGVAQARSEAELLEQAHALLALGPQAVLLKGGHAAGGQATDLLVTHHGVDAFSAPRSPHSVRGSGCALSSALAAHLAGGVELREACARAKRYVTRLFQHS
jgi:hydroxymethylpyrimidine/phosphomethylpyrimidine kinase